MSRGKKNAKNGRRPNYLRLTRQRSRQNENPARSTVDTSPADVITRPVPVCRQCRLVELAARKVRRAGAAVGMRPTAPEGHCVLRMRTSRLRTPVLQRGKRPRPPRGPGIQRRDLPSENGCALRIERDRTWCIYSSRTAPTLTVRRISSVMLD